MPGSGMDGWLRRAAVPSWWTAHRPLRMATDCSGIGVPEIAMQMMGQRTGGAVDHMWTCDVFKPSQKWLQGLMGEHTLLADMMERSFDITSGAFTATDIKGNQHTFKKDCNIDVYVCGFMCTPFTRNGTRQSWNHEDTKTFWATLKTILAVLPRSFVLENVISIHDRYNKPVLDKALMLLEKEYLVFQICCDSKLFGVPQRRARVYFVGVRHAELHPKYAGRSVEILRQFVEQKVKSFQTHTEGDKIDFRKFLKEEGLEVHEGQSSQSSESPESSPSSESSESCSTDCTCAVSVHCLAHPCTCSYCKDYGEHAKKCRWRINIRNYTKLQSSRKKRLSYLKLWRKVKNDDKLKVAPDYFSIAARKGIDTSSPHCPRQRVTLRELSYERNLLNGATILNLKKSFGRCQIRADGLVPTLGGGCLGFFLPSVASYLTVDHLLCLSGLSPRENKICYQLANDQNNGDMEWMMGNTMTLPVVGPVLSVALGMLRP